MGTNTQPVRHQLGLPFDEIADCEVCKALLAHKEELTIQENVRYILYVPVALVCPIQDKKNKERIKTIKGKRNDFVYELKKRISALRNQNGGAILVHIDGLDNDDKYLDYFNELVDDKLNDMIDDGSLFVNIYKKFWLSVSNCEGFNVSGVVTLIVHPTGIVSTIQFNTKIPLDNKIIDPLSNTIFNYLKGKVSFSRQRANLRGLENIQEGRSIQVKACYPADHSALTPTEIADRLWTDLRLREYVSAFSKVDEGGSFYFGVSEEEKNFSAYVTKEYTLKGINLNISQFENFQVSLEQQIQKKIEKETIILRCCGDIEATPKDTILVELYPLTAGKFVIEIAVASIEGLLFYDNEGPESYIAADNNTLRRLTLHEWFERCPT